MSTLKVNNLQVGQDSTPTNNLTWFQPGSPDGTIRLGSGNAGSATSKFTFDKDGNLTCVGDITANSIIAPIEGTLDDWIVHAGDTNTKIGFPANDEFEIHAGGPRLRITSAGVIRIGTQANHSATVQFADSSRDDAVTMKVDNSDDSDFDIVNNRNSGDITVATNSAERLRITSDGDVCINQSGLIDNAKLNIKCDATQPAIAVQCNHTNTDTKLISAWNSGGKNIVNITAESDNSPYLKFEILSGNNPIERFRVTHLGNVAIGGGTAASNRLEIIEDPAGMVSDSAQPNASVLIKHGTSGSNRRWIGFGASTSMAWMQSSSPGGSGLSAPFIINPGGGYIGLGSTTTPARTLHVSAGTPYIRVESTSANAKATLELYHTRSNGSDKWPSSISTDDGAITLNVANGNNGAPQEKVRINNDGMLHISDRNTANAGEHCFQAGAFGIRMQDTGGYNRWNIERNYGGWQSTPVVHLSAQGRVGINEASPDGTLHVSHTGENNVYVEGNTSSLGARIMLINRNTTANSFNQVEFCDAGGQGTSSIRGINVSDSTNEGFMEFWTRPSGGSPTKWVDITPTGELRGYASNGKMAFNNCQYYQFGGSVSCNATVSVNIPVLANGNIYKIMAMFAHHSDSYAAYREGTYGAYSGHSGIQINNDTVVNHSHSNCGSWTISRGSAGQPVVVSKSAGSYNGSGYWFVHVIAGTS